MSELTSERESVAEALDLYQEVGGQPLSADARMVLMYSVENSHGEVVDGYRATYTVREWLESLDDAGISYSLPIGKDELLMLLLSNVEHGPRHYIEGVVFETPEWVEESERLQRVEEAKRQREIFRERAENFVSKWCRARGVSVGLEVFFQKVWEELRGARRRAEVAESYECRAERFGAAMMSGVSTEDWFDNENWDRGERHQTRVDLEGVFAWCRAESPLLFLKWLNGCEDREEVERYFAESASGEADLESVEED